MSFQPVTPDDLEEIKKLQPADWSDIIPDITYYIRSSFCHPVKYAINHEIAGIGAAIIYGSTAWLAHIIVHPSFRNKGIGFAIVQELLKTVQGKNVESCLLTATAMGKPVYVKAGFRSISDYVFMNRENPWKERPFSEHIISYQEKYNEQLFRLDRQVSGENRERLLGDFLQDTKLYVVHEHVLGYCIPHLKEGPIIALTPEAGLELMKVKYSVSDKAVVPDVNQIAIDFLLSNGFKPTENRGTRMAMGKDVLWQPGKIFSRAGGNFG